MRVTCPICAATFEVEDGLAGATIHCRQCNEPIKVRQRAVSPMSAPSERKPNVTKPDDGGTARRDPSPSVPPRTPSAPGNGTDDPDSHRSAKEPWFYSRLIFCAFVVKVACVIAAVLVAIGYFFELAGLLAGQPYERVRASAAFMAIAMAAAKAVIVCGAIIINGFVFEAFLLVIADMGRSLRRGFRIA